MESVASVTGATNSWLNVSAIQHVSLPVDDLQLTIESLWKTLGIGPWAVFEIGTTQGWVLRYQGSSIEGDFKLAVAQAGPLEIEVIETIRGVSPYRDWMSKCGEGLHHLKFLVDDLDVGRVDAQMSQHSLPPFFIGRGGAEGGSRFSYFDTSETLGCVWETSNRAGGIPAGAQMYGGRVGDRNQSASGTTGISGVGLVVHDTQATAKEYSKILGIDNWQFFEVGTAVFREREYAGIVVRGREIIARTRVGDVLLELCQVIEGESVFRDRLKKRGEALNHLVVTGKSMDDEKRHLEDRGFTVLQENRMIEGGMRSGREILFEAPVAHLVVKMVVTSDAADCA